MKISGVFFYIAALTLNAGCATSTYTYGRDFPSANVKQIVIDSEFGHPSFYRR